jgi:integrase/recombinase XerD
MNVLKDVEVPPYKMFKEKRREEILTKKEYEKLKDYWMKKNPYYWNIISFVNNTGVRYSSELNNIQVRDVNLKKSYVMIRNRKSRSGIINTPVPLVGTSREIVEELLSRDFLKKPTDPLFLNDKGKQIKSINKPFKKSLIECGIEKNLTMYSLRHLFTTRMVRRPDIPIKVLSEVLGHTSTDMINKHYSHLKTEDYVNIFQRSEENKQDILKKYRQKDSDIPL